MPAEIYIPPPCPPPLLLHQTIDFIFLFDFPNRIKNRALICVDLSIDSTEWDEGCFGDSWGILRILPVSRLIDGDSLAALCGIKYCWRRWFEYVRSTCVRNPCRKAGESPKNPVQSVSDALCNLNRVNRVEIIFRLSWNWAQIVGRNFFNKVLFSNKWIWSTETKLNCVNQVHKSGQRQSIGGEPQRYIKTETAQNSLSYY